MKIIKTTVAKLFILFLLIGLVTSCEDYLDKAPDADITDEDVFSRFSTYQGFVEDMYNCIVDVANRDVHGMGNWNWGDDVTGVSSHRMGNFTHNSDYLGQWKNNDSSPFWASPPITTQPGDAGNNRSRRGYWSHGWLGIRKANMALENIDKLLEVSGSGSLEEQRNLILGQSYFFRAYFHFEIMRAWGGIPYINEFLRPDTEMRFPRLSYAETAQEAARDLEAAAELLPDDWDNMETGSTTIGKNEGRITKGAAYGYLGKNWLYAASPLMNGVSTGMYNYNIEYCIKAAEAFAKVIELADNGVYHLVPWTQYSDNFYKTDGSSPWTDEIIFKNPVNGNSHWNQNSEFLGVIGGWGTFASPTQNYVENFGMENGLPIKVKGVGDIPDSGFDPMAPFDNRDPRFYYNILKDGDRLFEAEVPGESNFAQLYVGGRDRLGANSVTGYGHKKFRPLRRNRYDDRLVPTFYLQLPQMRLADVYLMYAEAVNEAYGPNVVPADIPGGLTAVQAVNRVRERAGVPDVDPRFYTTELFREIIRQERAVELAFESHRWYDLRRWYIAHETEYRQIYSLEFDEDHSFFNRVLFTTKPFEMKHYWLPFDVSQVSIYPGFQQNPGW
jgi:starch-binding outer membrane protein, SusD/RagB family